MTEAYKVKNGLFPIIINNAFQVAAMEFEPTTT